jgi:hypothetical protein
MDALETYKLYVAVKNHFTIDTYDMFKYNRKVKVNMDSFLKRKDRIFFAKLGNRKAQYLEEFLVANFLYDPKIWIGELLSEECENRYKEWKRKQESLSYHFKNEMSFIEGWDSDELNLWFSCPDSDHPNIIKKFLRNEISLETLVMLNSIFNFMKHYDKRITDPIYKGVSQLCHKYQPFLKVDIQKQKRQLREMVTN